MRGTCHGRRGGGNLAGGWAPARGFSADANEPDAVNAADARNSPSGRIRRASATPWRSAAPCERSRGGPRGPDAGREGAPISGESEKKEARGAARTLGGARPHCASGPAEDREDRALGAGTRRRERSRGGPRGPGAGRGDAPARRERDALSGAAFGGFLRGTSVRIRAEPQLDERRGRTVGRRCEPSSATAPGTERPSAGRDGSNPSL
jgi:hypothetical protein